MKKYPLIKGGQTGKPTIAVLIGVTVSLGLSFLLSAILAWAVHGGRLQEDAIQTLIWPVHFLSTAIGALSATILAGRMPAVISAVCAGAYLLLLTAGNILFLDGNMTGIGPGALSVICGALVPICIKLIGQKGRRSPIRR